MCPNGEGHGVGSWDEISHLCTLDFGDLDLIYLFSKGGLQVSVYLEALGCRTTDRGEDILTCTHSLPFLIV